MKKNIKVLFGLALSTLLVGCNANSAYCNFYSVRARAVEYTENFFNYLLNGKFGGTYEYTVEYDRTDIKSTDVKKQEFEFDAKNKVFHISQKTTNNYVNTKDSSENLNEESFVEYYYVYESKIGLVAYKNDGSNKTKDVVSDNASLLDITRILKDNAGLGGFYAGEITLDIAVSFVLCEVFTSYSDPLVYGGLVEEVADADYVKDIVGDAKVVSEKYVAAPNSQKFSFEITTTYDVSSEDELDITGTWTNTFKDSVNGPINEYGYVSYSFEGKNNDGPETSTTTKSTIGESKVKAIKGVKLIDFSEYVVVE